MFKLLNPNMQEIKSPDGFIPLDIFVSSIGKERHTDKVEGMPGEVNYGTSYTSRDVELTMWFNARDTIDYRLLRDELYAYFDSYDYFYVIETNKPTRALKIVIDDSFRDKRITTRVGEITINARTVDSPFWVSLYTTKELNDTGYDALVDSGLIDTNEETFNHDLNVIEKIISRYDIEQSDIITKLQEKGYTQLNTTGRYGLVDGINSDNTKYKFTERNFSVWNAGNVTVEPETMYLNITALGASKDMEIRNKTTGETLKINAPHGGTLRVHGMSISMASINMFRYTNHRYISLAPGQNEFEVIGQFTDITIDFRFYYK